MRAETVTPVRAFVVGHDVSREAAALARDLAVRAGIVMPERELAAFLATFLRPWRSADI